MRVTISNFGLGFLSGLFRSNRKITSPGPVGEDSGGDVPNSLEIQFVDRVERPIEDVDTPPPSRTGGAEREEPVAHQGDVNETVTEEPVQLILPIIPALEVDTVPSVDVAEPEMPEKANVGKPLVPGESPSIIEPVQQVAPPAPAEENDLVKVVVVPVATVTPSDQPLVIEETHLPEPAVTQVQGIHLDLAAAVAPLTADVRPIDPEPEPPAATPVTVESPVVDLKPEPAVALDGPPAPLAEPAQDVVPTHPVILEKPHVETGVAPKDMALDVVQPALEITPNVADEPGMNVVSTKSLAVEEPEIAEAQEVTPDQTPDTPEITSGAPSVDLPQKSPVVELPGPDPDAVLAEVFNTGKPVRIKPARTLAAPAEVSELAQKWADELKNGKHNQTRREWQSSGLLSGYQECAVMVGVNTLGKDFTTLANGVGVAYICDVMEQNDLEGKSFRQIGNHIERTVGTRNCPRGREL